MGLVSSIEHAGDQCPLDHSGGVRLTEYLCLFRVFARTRHHLGDSSLGWHDAARSSLRGGSIIQLEIEGLYWNNLFLCAGKKSGAFE